MDKLNDDTRVLAGGITEFLRNEKATNDDTRPLERPALLDDPKAAPHKRAEAGQVYAEALLTKTNALTKGEQDFLAAAIRDCLKENG